MDATSRTDTYVSERRLLLPDRTWFLIRRGWSRTIGLAATALGVIAAVITRFLLWTPLLTRPMLSTMLDRSRGMLRLYPGAASHSP